MKYKSKEGYNNDIPGLSKSVFFCQLKSYGISISAVDKSILTGVFSLDGQRGVHMMDYVKLDLVFEGVIQQLYAKSKYLTSEITLFVDSLYTNEWERRIFRQIGDHLISQNETLHGMFNMIK